MDKYNHHAPIPQSHSDLSAAKSETQGAIGDVIDKYLKYHANSMGCKELVAAAREEYNGMKSRIETLQLEARNDTALLRHIADMYAKKDLLSDRIELDLDDYMHPQPAEKVCVWTYLAGTSSENHRRYSTSCGFRILFKQKAENGEFCRCGLPIKVKE
jgi:hypothetical protein